VVASLPRPVRLKLQQTLSQWRHWRCDEALAGPPEPVALLAEGLSNYSVLVGAPRHFVVRIDGIDPARHGLNRQGEWRAMQLAHRAGLAPQPCYFNPELGSLVCDYVEPEQGGPQAPSAVAALLRAIHALPPIHSRLELRERIQRYEKQLADRGEALPVDLRDFREQVSLRLSRVQQRNATRVLCHNDLLAANRIASGGRLWAIDWEYCAMADPWYELAVVSCGDELSPEVSRELVTAYLGRQPSREERAALLDYCGVYRYLELLWYLAQEHPAMTPGRQARAVERLGETLALNP